MKALIAIPVYNEERYVERVIEKVRPYAPHILFVDDGSTDATPRILARFPVEVIRRAENRGYGRSIRDSFRWAILERYDWLVTMDCDEQHEPEFIPEFLRMARSTDADVISGSRYLRVFAGDDDAPSDRREINTAITAEVNCRLGDRLGITITDAFCGFKAHRVESLRKLRPTVNGYAFPAQFWTQCAAAGLRVAELPVRRIYKDASRTFGGNLDNPTARLAHYREILHREIRRQQGRLPARAMLGLGTRLCP